MRQAIALARRGCGRTSPNPMVGAVLVRAGRVIGRGWHRAAGQAHAEIEALRDAERRGQPAVGATLYVTLEPCSTHGRTPPCTEAIRKAGIRRVVAAAIDPNPAHEGRGLRWLRRAGIQAEHGLLAARSARLNEAFHHWIVCRRPFVTVKAAMTLDGKLATASGESRWITSAAARAVGMRMRLGADAILAGVNTVLADDPSLTWRPVRAGVRTHRLRRIVLDALGRTPLGARVVSDEQAELTTVVVTSAAPARRREALAARVRVWIAPGEDRVDLAWLLDRLGTEDVTHLLVEGGGEVQASFLEGRLAQRITLFYAPIILGSKDALRAVAGSGFSASSGIPKLHSIEWRRVGADLMLTARVDYPEGTAGGG